MGNAEFVTKVRNTFSIILYWILPSSYKILKASKKNVKKIMQSSKEKVFV